LQILRILANSVAAVSQSCKTSNVLRASREPNRPHLQLLPGVESVPPRCDRGVALRAENVRPEQRRGVAAPGPPNPVGECASVTARLVRQVGIPQARGGDRRTRDAGRAESGSLTRLPYCLALPGAGTAWCSTGRR